MNPSLLSTDLLSLPLEVPGDFQNSSEEMHILDSIREMASPLDLNTSIQHPLTIPSARSMELVEMLTVGTPVSTYTVSINKMKIIIDGGLKTILREAALLFNKFASSKIGGVWSSVPIDEQVVHRAEIYLKKILRKNDVSNSESVAISAAALFLKENDSALKDLVKTHTDLMECGPG